MSKRVDCLVIFGYDVSVTAPQIREKIVCFSSQSSCLLCFPVSAIYVENICCNVCLLEVDE
jgi:hypothetical protein